MAKVFALIVAAFLLLGAGPSIKSPVDLLEIAERSLVVVTTDTSFCTGFVVDAARGRVLTVRHCIADFNTRVDDRPAEIIKFDDRLALLSSPRMTQPPLRVRGRNPSLGTHVVAVGYGGTLLTILNRGVAAYASDYDFDLILDGEAIAGMSGGPVLDLYGDVVGIVQATNPLVGISLATSAERIRDFLDRKPY